MQYVETILDYWNLLGIGEDQNQFVQRLKHPVRTTTNLLIKLTKSQKPSKETQLPCCDIKLNHQTIFDQFKHRSDLLLTLLLPWLIFLLLILPIRKQNKWAASWENQRSAYAKTKRQISFAVTVKLISAFVFAIWIVQSLYFLYTKCQASSHLHWLHGLVCVRPGQNPHRWFSHAAAKMFAMVLTLA